MLDGGPECPEPLAYLLGWCYQLHGRSGMTEHGVSPLMWTTVDAWSRLTGNVLVQEEIDTLFLLDGILIAPGEMKADG